MIDTFLDGGTMMWVLTLAAFLMVGLFIRAGLELRTSSGDPAEALASADAALFWGAFAGLLGVLGTLIGVMQAARAIQMAGEVSAALAWAGVRVTLITTVYGLFILLTALLVWGGLRLVGPPRSTAPTG